MKRIVLLVLAIGLSTHMAFAAGQQGAGEMQEGPVKLTFFMNLTGPIRQAGGESNDDVACYQIAEERLGIDIEWVHPSDHDTELNIMAASDDLTDLVQSGWGAYAGGVQKAYDDELIIALSDHMDKAPNYKKVLAQYPQFRREAITDDGLYLGFTRLETGFIDRPYIGFHIRKDWLDNLGLEVPTTIEEWHSVLTAFKEAELAGPGNAPFIGRDADMNFLRFSGVWGVLDLDFQLDYQSGKVIYPKMQPEYKEFLETMLQWGEEGLIDPEHLAADESTIQANYINGRGGACYHYVSRFVQWGEAAKEINPNYEDWAAPYPKGPDGKPYAQTDFNRMAPGDWTTISETCNNIDAAVKWVDYGFSEEGALLFNWGVEGESYVVEGGEKKFLLDPIAVKLWAKVDNGSSRIMDVDASFAAYTDFQKEMTGLWVQGSNYDLHIPFRITHTTEESRRLATLLGDIKTYTEETVQKILLGAESIDIWDEYVATLEKMGVDEVVAIKQAAYDRYMKR